MYGNGITFVFTCCRIQDICAFVKRFFALSPIQPSSPLCFAEREDTVLQVGAMNCAPTCIRVHLFHVVISAFICFML